MKLLKCITATALAIVFVIAGVNYNAFNVSAGSSDIVVDNTSFSEGLDTAKWNSVSGDILVENGQIVFPQNSTGNTRLITKLAATKSSRHEELFSADYQLSLNKLPAGEKFIVAFSLSSIEAYYEESGNVELVFENNNGVKASLVAYDEDGNAIILAEPQNYGVSGGSVVRISANAYVDQNLNIKVNGKSVYNEACPVELEGRIGFLQTGNCEVRISSVNIVSHKYDTPENTNIVEDFESGSINVNTLTSKMTSSCNYFPSGIQVEEYNGSNVLMFRNANMGYFGTKHQYSNFEATFDVPYMLHTSILRENGTILTPNHSAFIFAIGGESDEYSTFGYGTASDALVFNSTKVYSMRGEQPSAIFSDKNFYDKQSTDGYSVKIKVVDTMLSVSMKALDETEYQEILSYKMGNATPIGYIHIWSNGQANFAIDNFKITNLDKDGQEVELDYQDGFVTGYEDWEYKPMEVVYLEQSDKGFNWTMIIVYAAIVSVVIVVVGIVVSKMKGMSKKRGEANEN